ncbi:MAG: DUF2844 domain-containing protein [Candidatus Sulfotelmatobacter sp.]
MAAIGSLFAFAIASLPAWAALGGDISTVQADQVHMRGSLRTTVAAAYTVHEIQGASGVVVREYVSTSGTSAGKVFAIAWQGPWPPDMRQLLGSYFDPYIQAARARSGPGMARRPLTIQQPGLVVQVGGHPRSFIGRAYIPDQLPSNVTTEEIR